MPIAVRYPQGRQKPDTGNVLRGLVVVCEGKRRDAVGLRSSDCQIDKCAAILSFRRNNRGLRKVDIREHSAPGSLTVILSTVRELHVSSNGDKWELTEDDENRLFIRHTPNEASGGRQSIMTLASFLQPDHEGPQQDALKQLIEDGELVLSPTPPKQQHFA
jgi:hypothetical protein